MRCICTLFIHENISDFGISVNEIVKDNRRMIYFKLVWPECRVVLVALKFLDLENPEKRERIKAPLRGRSLLVYNGKRK